MDGAFERYPLVLEQFALPGNTESQRLPLSYYIIDESLFFVSYMMKQGDIDNIVRYN